MEIEQSLYEKLYGQINVLTGLMSFLFIVVICLMCCFYVYLYYRYWRVNKKKQFNIEGNKVKEIIEMKSLINNDAETETDSDEEFYNLIKPMIDSARDRIKVQNKLLKHHKRHIHHK